MSKENKVEPDCKVPADASELRSRRGRSSRCKGQRGEREATSLLQPIVDIVYIEAGKAPPKLQRNTIQSDSGGFDIVGLSWLALEVKRCETLHVAQWWYQAVKQAKRGQVPVLMYRQNGGKWRVRLWSPVLLSTTLDAHTTWAPSDIDLDSFLQAFRQRLIHEVQSDSLGR